MGTMSNLQEQDKVMTFYLCDDLSDNFYVGRISRKKEELIPELANLKIGNIFPINNHKFYLRES